MPEQDELTEVRAEIERLKATHATSMDISVLRDKLKEAHMHSQQNYENWQATKAELSVVRRERDEERAEKETSKAFYDDEHKQLAVMRRERDEALRAMEDATRQNAAQVDRLVADKRESDRLRENAYDDSMIAHQWFAEAFGEQMNGRDFAVKVPMAVTELSALRLRLDAAEKDTARLDHVMRDLWQFKQDDQVFRYGGHQGKTGREAIDASIDAAREKAQMTADESGNAADQQLAIVRKAFGLAENFIITGFAEVDGKLVALGSIPGVRVVEASR